MFIRYPPLGPPITSARSGRGTWALFAPGEEVVVVHPDGADPARRSGDRTWSIPAVASWLSGPANDHGYGHNCEQAGRFCISTATASSAPGLPASLASQRRARHASTRTRSPQRRPVATLVKGGSVDAPPAGEVPGAGASRPSSATRPGIRAGSHE